MCPMSQMEKKILIDGNQVHNGSSAVGGTRP